MFRRKKNTLKTLRRLEAHESGVRSLMAESHGESYVAMRTLGEAKAVPDGVVILEGDDGGQIYVVVPARLVKCTEGTLGKLLRDLDALAWPDNDQDAARVFFERGAPGSGVWGGMGGAAVTEGVWVHEELRHLQQAIEDVIGGRAASIPHSTDT